MVLAFGHITLQDLISRGHLDHCHACAPSTVSAEWIADTDRGVRETRCPECHERGSEQPLYPLFYHRHRSRGFSEWQEAVTVAECRACQHAELC